MGHSHRKSPIVIGTPGPTCPPHHWRILSGGHAYCMKPGCRCETTFPLEAQYKAYGERKIVEEVRSGED
jgi:hypothetical protein